MKLWVSLVLRLIPALLDALRGRSKHSGFDVPVIRKPRKRLSGDARKREDEDPPDAE